MQSLHPTDLLQVTAQMCGSVLLTMTMSGARSIGDVFRKVRDSTPDSTSGIVSISLRNRTQGWTCRHNLIIKPVMSNETGSIQNNTRSLFAS